MTYTSINLNHESFMICNLENGETGFIASVGRKKVYIEVVKNAVSAEVSIIAYNADRTKVSKYDKTSVILPVNDVCLVNRAFVENAAKLKEILNSVHLLREYSVSF